MKKIGILTFFDYNNYGTVLQAYALQEKIKELGYYSELIDYKSYDNRKNLNQKIKEALKHPRKLIAIVRKKIDKIVHRNKIEKTLDRYNDFKQRFIISKEKYFYVSDLEKSVDKYDIFIIGSDQTWNTSLPITTQAFFLNFVPDYKIKFSYAPSIGGKSFSKINEYSIIENLNKFDALSCRDKIGIKLIEKFTKKRIEYVLDPTFLIDVDKWKSIMVNPQNIEKDYVLCYFLGKKKKNFKIVEEYAKKNNLKLYYIYNFDTKIKKNRNYLFNVGPSEFLGLINNAKYVFTDSFHGTVFSLLFKKDFYAFTKRKDVKSSDNNRIYEILELFSLQHRYVEEYKDILGAEKINYENVYDIIEKLKKKSLDFLSQSLNIKLSDKAIPQNDIRCTGCTACYNIYPTGCIEMKKDEEGFLFPYINKQRCINCGKCKTVCQIFKKRKEGRVINSYAGINKDKSILLKSSSGGIFFNMANWVISQKGIVCACNLDADFKAKHLIIDKKEDLLKVMGSKYIQSDLEDTFKEVEKNLKEKRIVLYVATPCQIQGLKNYLNKEYDNLLTIDLICHGVPSQKFFDKYIEQFPYKLQEYNFRYKDISDDSDAHRLYYKYSNGKEIIVNNVFLDSYYYAFLKGYNYRKCCYECNFANTNRVGDITLGDFWGCNKYHKMKIENGVSAILINTEKGQKYFEQIQGDFCLQKTEVKYIKEKNHNLNYPVNKPPERKNIYRILNKRGYSYLKKNLKPKNYMLIKIKSYIPLRIKRRINNCIGEKNK